MISQTMIRSGLMTGLIAGFLAVTAPPALAGGGAAIGRMAEDLTTIFNRAANPTVPPRVPEARLVINPPEYTPLGGHTWSPSQVHGVTPPQETLTGTFNRTAGDGVGSGGLTDSFNATGRGN